MAKKKKAGSRSLASMVLVTALAVICYRIGAHVPLPGIAISPSVDNEFLRTAAILSGSSLSKATVMGLGATPYIMASIVMQALQTAVPAVKHIAQDGAAGRNKVTQWTRRLSVLFAAIAAVLYLRSSYGTIDGVDDMLLRVIDGVILVAGATVLMRLGEIVDEQGLGQGMSVIICASILSQVPASIATATYVSSDLVRDGAVAALILLVSIPVVIKMERAVMKVPVTYGTSRVSANVHDCIPIRLVVAGVVPVIFASALVSLPLSVLGAFDGLTDAYTAYYGFTSGWGGVAVQFVLIMVFAFVYAALAFDTDAIAENLAKSGGYVVGARPGAHTAALLRKTVRRVTWPGGFMMAVVAMAPSAIALVYSNSLISALGGTSLVIVVDVVIQVADAVAGELAGKRHDKLVAASA